MSSLYAGFLIALVVMMALFLSNSNRLERLDLMFYDALLPLQNNTLSKQVVIVAVDDISIQSLGRRWPWPRRNHAQLLDRLTSMGARAIGFD
jgi:CHASE2 domain-containing sensor protein